MDFISALPVKKQQEMQGWIETSQDTLEMQNNAEVFLIIGQEMNLLFNSKSDVLDNIMKKTASGGPILKQISIKFKISIYYRGLFC